jgi:ABC-2 type transport system ATP-binding protein
MSATAIAPVVARAAAPAGAVLVRLDGLGKRFHVRRGVREMLRRPLEHPMVDAVRDARFEIREGEFFGLLGRNGAGKTTLLKMLATLVLPDTGTATVAGCDIVREPARVRRLLATVVSDERSLNWRLSALENLRLFAALHGLRGGAARDRVVELLETVELADTGRKLVGDFSSGMRQRLLIARALLARPRVLLLDEPTRSLDPLAAQALRRLLRDELATRQRCAVLLATHNAEEALELCDRVAVMDRGTVLAVGTAASLAADLGEGRYAVWMRDALWPVAMLAERGLARCLTTDSPDAEGWTRVELAIPGGPEGSAATLSALVRAGVEVARFERVPVPLAELIARVVHRHGEPRDA